jgi:small subunit ribosomal protein S14
MKTRIERDNKNRALVYRLEKKRKQYKVNIIENEKISERLYWINCLNALNTSSSRTRITNRCSYTGRAKGKLRHWKISRIKFREKALAGELPGVQKASW